jgi:flagellar FliJ protein
MFHFKLQSVLDVRKTLEEKVFREFTQLLTELQKENERLQSIQQQKMTLIDELRNVQGKTVNVSEIRMNAEFVKQCLKSETLQQEQVREAERIAEMKKEALYDAVKKRKSMETLKNKQHHQYRYDLSLIDRTAIDEMGIVRYNRKNEE